jgi:hypothetical protein
MKKNTEELSEGIFLIKNYISKSTCDFLIKEFSKNLSDTPRKNILGGISGGLLLQPDTAGDYSDDLIYNIAIDTHNGILFSINDLVSNKFKDPHRIKTYFFSCMLPGAFNDVHMDNHYFDDDGNILVKPKMAFDKSGLLYLNDDYEGGELVFPEQGLSIKAEAGSLIFFEGDYKKPHGVNQVISGTRYNLVTFYEPVN